MDDDFDFGFTSVSETEFKTRENKVAKQVRDQTKKEADDKVQKMYDMIMPLLKNLQKDADEREYIYWPQRKEKIDEFIAKLDSIIKTD